jgi:hypothetical protein
MREAAQKVFFYLSYWIFSRIDKGNPFRSTRVLPFSFCHCIVDLPVTASEYPI